MIILESDIVGADKQDNTGVLMTGVSIVLSTPSLYINKG